MRIRAGCAVCFPSRDYFRRDLLERRRPRVELQPPVRLRDFVVGGQARTVAQAYLDLVMANNTDIAIQMAQRGDGTRTPSLRAFRVFRSAGHRRHFTQTRGPRTPTTDALAGAATLNQLAQPADFSLPADAARPAPSTTWFNGIEDAPPTAVRYLQPGSERHIGVQLHAAAAREPRLGYINQLPITIARSRLRVSRVRASDDTSMSLVAEAENAYWDVILGAREPRVCSENALDLADKR